MLPEALSALRERLQAAERPEDRALLAELQVIDRLLDHPERRMLYMHIGSGGTVYVDCPDSDCGGRGRKPSP